jgi:hypothetical protein
MHPAIHCGGALGTDSLRRSAYRGTPPCYCDRGEALQYLELPQTHAYHFRLLVKGQAAVGFVAIP